MKVKRTVTDQPHVSGQEAAGIFGMSYRKWRPLFKTKLHNVIRVEMTAAGFKPNYLLIDVYKAAFPEASNHTIHIMANDWLMRKAAGTVRSLRLVKAQNEKVSQGGKK